MIFSSTPVTAALAGIFSALTWPWLWSEYGQDSSGGSLELMLGTVLLVALPAHLFVMGLGYRAQPGTGPFDPALLRRVACWLIAGAATAGLASLYR